MFVGLKPNLRNSKQPFLVGRLFRPTQNKNINHSFYSHLFLTNRNVYIIWHFIGLKSRPTKQPISEIYSFISIPKSSHIASTRALISSSMTMGSPHSRSVSPFHLLVASIPILLPKPETGDAKSK